MTKLAVSASHNVMAGYKITMLIIHYLTCSDLQILMNIFSPLSVLVFKQNPEQEKHTIGQ